MCFYFIIQGWKIVIQREQELRPHFTFQLYCRKCFPLRCLFSFVLPFYLCFLPQKKKSIFNWILNGWWFPPNMDSVNLKAGVWIHQRSVWLDTTESPTYSGLSRINILKSSHFKVLAGSPGLAWCSVCRDSWLFFSGSFKM